MTTKDIELLLMREFKFNQNLMVPCVNSGVMFETDMLHITEHGYATGFEIKISYSDLKADLKKPQISSLNEVYYGKTGLERYYGAFKYFYYAIPESLYEKTLSLIDPRFGVVVIKKREHSGRLYCQISRKPKLLFNKKWSEKEILRIAKLGAMRIYGLKSKLG